MINNEYENCLDEVENLDENNADFEQFTYVQKESELDDILEHMFETVIKPYIENYCQKEILHKFNYISKKKILDPPLGLFETAVHRSQNDAA